MLKIIKLRNQRKQKENALATLREDKKKFELRKAELEAASNDAQTDEDIEEINAQIEELETELNGRDLDQEEQTLVDEIAGIDAEIAEMTNNPYCVDTVVIGRFTFPVCNYQQQDATVSLQLKCSIANRQTSYSRDMYLDCIYLKPVSDEDAIVVKETTTRKEAQK